MLTYIAYMDPMGTRITGRWGRSENRSPMESFKCISHVGKVKTGRTNKKQKVRNKKNTRRSLELVGSPSFKLSWPILDIAKHLIFRLVPHLLHVWPQPKRFPAMTLKQSLHRCGPTSKAVDCIIARKAFRSQWHLGARTGHWGDDINTLIPGL